MKMMEIVIGKIEIFLERSRSVEIVYLGKLVDEIFFV